MIRTKRKTLKFTIFPITYLNLHVKNNKMNIAKRMNRLTHTHIQFNVRSFEKLTDCCKNARNQTPMWL